MATNKLENVHLGFSPLTNTVYIYVPEKNDPSNAKDKKDITSEFEFIAKELGYVKKDAE